MKASAQYLNPKWREGEEGTTTPKKGSRKHHPLKRRRAKSTWPKKEDEKAIPPKG